MVIYGRIVKIGTWSSLGWPVDWEIVSAVDHSKIGNGALLQITADKVCVNGVEIVMWSQARLKAMGKGE